MTDQELADFYEDEYYDAYPFLCDASDETISIKAFGIGDWEFDYKGLDNVDVQKTLRPILEEAAAFGICEVLRGLRIEIDWFGIRLESVPTGLDVPGFHRVFRWQEILAEDARKYAPGMMVGGAEACDDIAKNLERLAANYRQFAIQQREADVAAVRS